MMMKLRVMVFSRIWDKFVEYLGSILVAIIIFFPYIIGPVIALIFILSELDYITFFNFIR